MNTGCRWLLMAVVVVAMVATVAMPDGAQAAKRGARSVPPRHPHPLGAQSTTDTPQAPDVDRRIDANSLNLWVWNNGSIAFADPNAGLIWPKGTTNTAVFASGLWMAAEVGGQTRIAVAEYTQDCAPGPMIGTNPPTPSPAYKVYKVIRFTGDLQDTAHVDRSAEEQAADPNLDPLVHHSWSEYLNGAAPYGAPTRYYHLNSEAPDDSVLGPDILGDQMLWSVYNDANPEQHGGDFNPPTQPLGIEVRQTTFAFNRQGPLGNTVFLRYKLYNKGGNTLDNMFVSLWSDPDLGGFTDDLVGCDTTLSLGFVYNATNRDQFYGRRPPAVGYDFFLGPVANGDTLPMTSFNKYINGTDPASPTEVYDYMNGLTGNGDPVIDPQGVTTKFTNAGDPVTGRGWLDTNPADRRFMMSSGPFRMAPGDSQEVVGAIMVAQGRDRLSSISGLRFFDVFAQDAFDKAFLLPSPPPQPKVVVAESPNQVRLCWDAAARLNYPKAEDNAAGYKFEGYNVYQGETVAGPWQLVATYDEVDQIRVIFDQVFDPVTGQTIPQYPVAFGSDAGVQFCHTVTEDAIRGGPLRNGTQYYFAITAYSYNPAGLPTVLENAQQVIRVMPQAPAGGTNLSTATASCPTYLQKDTGLPKATDRISIEVVNPDLVTGHTYKITFAPLPAPVVNANGDTATVGWSLVDSTTHTVLFQNEPNRGDDDDYQVVDGIKVRVASPLGASTPGLSDGGFLCLPKPQWPLDGNVALQGPEFNGGLTYAIDDPRIFAGLDPTAAPDSFSTVEIRFGGSNRQKVYRYLLCRTPDGDVPDIGSAYLYGGFREQPFTVWDTDRNVQLDAAFVEKVFTAQDGTFLPPSQQPATFDSLWSPNASDDGNRDLLFIERSAYSDVENPIYAVDDPVRTDILPHLYELWARKVSINAAIAPGSVFRILSNANPAGPNDVFVFSTAAVQHNNTALAKANLSRVRAVPNPYYTRSRYEQNQFNRVVRFTNLPENCTVRIFNLAGDLVRTLRKTDATSSIVSWDLLTENRLPVASGVYIFHVEAPGAGETTGRMIIFMEKERLNSL